MKRTSRRARGAALQRRQRIEAAQPGADGEHALAREEQGALAEGLGDLDLGRLQPVPQHHVAGR